MIDGVSTGVSRVLVGQVSGNSLTRMSGFDNEDRARDCASDWTNKTGISHAVVQIVSVYDAFPGAKVPK